MINVFDNRKHLVRHTVDPKFLDPLEVTDEDKKYFSEKDWEVFLKMRDEREKFLREKVDVQMESKEENREKRKRSE
jgi:hypothetical protein